MFPLAFGFSPPDIGIILILALFIFGPKKLPEIGKQLGQAMREMRKVTDELTGAMHSVHSEVESVYKPVMSPPYEYGNPYSGTSSATVEKAAARKSYDQDPEDLMAPIVHPAAKVEEQAGLPPEIISDPSFNTARSDALDKKGH